GREGPGGDGERDQAGDGSRPAGLSRRSHPEEALRERVEPARRSDRGGVIRLYLITPPSGDPVRAVEAALAVLPRGSAGVQLRQLDLSARELLERARALRDVCTGFAAPLLINDRAAVALASGADGVPLPAPAASPASAACWARRIRRTRRSGSGRRWHWGQATTEARRPGPGIRCCAAPGRCGAAGTPEAAAALGRRRPRRRARRLDGRSR